MKKKANPQNKVIVERVIDEELPPGWVKEIRIKKSSNGVRRDPFYNDTTTGYVFRSKLDVLRYLETGEISKHAYKRKDGGNVYMPSMQETPSAATVKSHNDKGKETLEESLSPNRGNSKVRETVSDIVSDAVVTPIHPQKPEANENDVVHMDCDPKTKQKSNNEVTGSSRRSSSRLAGVETELVTHTVAIERVLRAANKKTTKNESSEPNQAAQSQQQDEIAVAEQMKPNEQSAVSTSKRKPERSRKKIVSPRQSSNLLPEIEAKPVPVSVPTKRVLRSSTTKPVITEPTPCAKTEAEESPIVNVEKEEETVKNDNEERRNRRPTSRERKPKRNRKEIVSPVTHTTKRVLRSESNKSDKIEDKKEDAPPVINSQEILPAEDEAVKEIIQTVIRECTPVEPSSNDSEVERINQTPKHNSKEVVATDEATAVIETNGKEKEKEKEKAEQDTQFSFPWSDPCIEFAYKTLTGVLPLDDTLAIHDYVQHQIRTSSHTTTKNFTPNPSNSSTSITFPDPGPPGFSRVPLADTTPPGFSLNDVPPANDSGPPGFSRANGNNTPPGFSRSSINNPPVFPWSTAPPAVPDTKPPGFPWDTVSNPDPKPAGPPGFPWSTVPSNSGTGINLNVALPDSAPPGFSQKIIPSKQQPRQQQTNQAGNGSQSADLPFQGTVFSWNHRN